MTGVVAFAEEAETETESSAAQTEESVTASGDSDKFDSGYPNLDPNAPVTEKLLYGIDVTVIGMAVVFLVLILIMALLYAFRVVAKLKTQNPAEAPQAAPAPAAAPAAPVAPVAPAADDEQLIVAIATAAIAAERGESECAFKVISITKLQ